MIATLADRPLRPRGPVLAVCLLGAFAVNLDQGAVPIASPAIADSLAASLGDLQWVTNAFLLPLTVLLVGAGAFSDRFGRTRVLAAGLGLFVVGSAAGAVAGSVGVLIAMRAVEGAGAALVVPTTIAALRSAFVGAQLAKALGLWLSAALAGASLGPVIGGLLIDLASWRAVLWPNVVLGTLALGLAVHLLRFPDPHRRDVRLGVAENALVAAGLAGLVYGLIRGGADGFGSAVVIGAIVGGSAVLAACAAWVGRPSGAALANVAVPRFAGGLAVLVLAFVGNVGVYFFAALWLQRVLGLSPLAAGVALLPNAALGAALSPLGGRLVARVGPERPLVAGLALQVVALVGLSFLDADSGYGAVAPFLVVMGLSVALVPAAAFTLVLASAPAERSGLASGAQTAALNLGGTLSVAVLGAVVASTVRGHYERALDAEGLTRPIGADAVAGLAQGIPEQPGGVSSEILDALERVGHDAFSLAMGDALRVAACVVALGVGVALWLSLHDRRGPDARGVPGR